MAMNEMAAPAPDEAMPTPAGYEICISVDGAGKITVGVESADQEAAESQGGDESGEAAMPVGSIREAVATAMEIYKNDGAMPDGQDDAEFNGGFGKAKAAPRDTMLNEE